MIKPYYIDKKTRVKVVRRIVDYAIVLQRKRWYGWKNITRTYPEVMRDRSMQETIDQLLYQENEKDFLGMAKKIFES